MITPVHASGGLDPYVYFFNETWGDFSEEIVKAKEEGKKGVLLFFEMDECPFCHRMKETVLNVEITDFEGGTISQKDFAFKVNRVRATPVFAFYDLSGKKVMRYTGATTGIEEFMWLGKFVAEGKYKEMRFAKYKRQMKKQ